MKTAWLLIACAACGKVNQNGGDDTQLPACTPEGQQVAGTELAFDEIDLSGSQPDTCSGLLAGADDVAAAFPQQDEPPALDAVDFSTDRVVLSLSNPQIEFAVDDGAELVVGEEQLCQGVAPTCVAYVVHGVTRGTLAIDSCPYTGPDPCTAP